MDFSYLAEGLNISDSIRDKLRSITTLTHLEILAQSITSHILNDEYLLAPRLFMTAGLYDTPTNIVDYAFSLRHRLNERTFNLMMEHSDKINLFYQQHHDPLYQYVRDSIAAQKWLKSNLLVSGFGKGLIECPEFQAVRVMSQLYHYDIDVLLQKAEEMFNQYYTHASPTLFNAGTKNPQLGSCFQVEIFDNIESLMYRGVGDISEISKNNGGVGIGVNKIRHSAISYSGDSKGVVPFIKIFDSAIGCVDQGGMRNGAATIFMRDWHIDLEDFIRRLPKDADLNIAIKNIQGCIWMSDLFYERLRTGGKWTFFCPHQCSKLCDAYGDEFENEYIKYEQLALERSREFEQLEEELKILRLEILSHPVTDLDSYRAKISAKKQQISDFIKNKQIRYHQVDAVEFMKLITEIQIGDGPYMMNADAINRKSQVMNIGPINLSNLCTEIVQHTSEQEIPTCNLGAMNLPKYVRGKTQYDLSDVPLMTSELRRCYDFGTLGSKIRSLVQNIDRIIEENAYPLDKMVDGKLIRGPISQTNFRNRPQGIGISGLYNAMTGMGFGFESDLGFFFNKMVFGCMYYNALVESLRLAIVHGPYQTFKTGQCKLFNSETSQFDIMSGSPLSNGFFQFDLAQTEYHYLKYKNRLTEEIHYDDGEVEEIYKLNNILPLDPTCWHQEPVIINETHYETGEKVTFTIQPTWETLRHFIQIYGVRNSLLIAPMPTASTANIVSAVEAFEAPTGLIYTKRMKDVNDIYVVPEFISEIKSLNIFTRGVFEFIASSQGSIKNLDKYFKRFEPTKKPDIKRLQSIFKTAFEISQRNTARMCQQRGIYIDQSQSYNVFLPSPDPDILRDFHEFANSLGLKTGMYYLRQPPAIPPFPISYQPDVAKFARDLLKSEQYENLNDEPEKEMVCTREKGCVSCSV